jgi:hypothetical protein
VENVKGAYKSIILVPLEKKLMTLAEIVKPKFTENCL